ISVILVGFLLLGSNLSAHFSSTILQKSSTRMRLSHDLHQILQVGWNFQGLKVKEIKLWKSL
ncbi:MAG: hypothetical protein PV340_01205, partial [Wolbachia sp.]|nr:hypothetical protein [Wolbachia sp.]MDD9336390.1 hypothetical protein [Wolbachia sp.]